MITITIAASNAPVVVETKAPKMPVTGTSALCTRDRTNFPVGLSLMIFCNCAAPACTRDATSENSVLSCEPKIQPAKASSPSAISARR